MDLDDVTGGDLTCLVGSTQRQVQTCDLSYDGAWLPDKRATDWEPLGCRRLFPLY